jgi:hypothetical protein
MGDARDNWKNHVQTSYSRGDLEELAAIIQASDGGSVGCLSLAGRGSLRIQVSDQYETQVRKNLPSCGGHFAKRSAGPSHWPKGAASGGHKT